MCKKIFIAATGQNCGKTTMSVSLMHLARIRRRRQNRAIRERDKRCSLRRFEVSDASVLVRRVDAIDTSLIAGGRV